MRSLTGKKKRPDWLSKTDVLLAFAEGVLRWTICGLRGRCNDRPKAIDCGLTPRQLDHLLRNKTPECDIAAVYNTDVIALRRSPDPVGAGPLSGRGRSA